MPAWRHLLGALVLLLPMLPAADARAQAARSFLIFFDLDRSELSPIATQIIDEVVKSATTVSQQGSLTGIEVRGHTDRASGSPAAAMAMSLRAAEVVAGVIVAKGIPRATLHVIAYGDKQPLVATGPGVHEPQNRRVEVILRQ